MRVSSIVPEGWLAYRPEVVHEQIEDAQDDHQYNGTQLGLQPDHDHHTRYESDHTDQNPPEAPVTSKHEANKKEDEQHTTSKLNVHLPVLLLNLGKAGENSGLLDEAITKDHQESSHHRQIPQKEVEVENQSVTKGLNYHDGEETCNSVFTVPSHDDQGRAY